MVGVLIVLFMWGIAFWVGAELLRWKRNEWARGFIIARRVWTLLISIIFGIVSYYGISEQDATTIGASLGIMGLMILFALFLFTLVVLISLVFYTGEVVSNRTKRHHPAHVARAIWEKSKRKPKEKRKNEWA